MNPGAKINQFTFKFSHAPNDNNLLTLTAESFEVENNPIYLCLGSNGMRIYYPILH